MHVPSMRRNLISGSLLNKAVIKLIFGGDKLVLTTNGEFVGKGFCCGVLFVLDATCNGMNKNATFTYIFDSIDMWHVRLEHMNDDSIWRMKILILIPDQLIISSQNVKFVW
ncbi:hypothetical protein ACH5RR_006636 [Cinchona calisaya]|uniref:Uncharacterized protein n=1 Tax=Cinchona calisaya TaxID=153742 RepID=A0ABD3APK4_9GENT